MFYSVYGLFQKIGLAMGVAASRYKRLEWLKSLTICTHLLVTYHHSWALGAAGYKAPESDDEDAITTQPDSVIWTLRYALRPRPIQPVQLI